MQQPNVYERLKLRLELDPGSIDEDLIRHPVWLQDATELAAEALQVREMRKFELSVVEATIDEELRRAPPPQEEKAPRRTEKQIESKVKTDIRLYDATKVYEEARLDCSLWQGLVDSLKSKSKMLETYSSLLLAGFVAPNAAYENRKAELARRRDARPPLRRGNDYPD